MISVSFNWFDVFALFGGFLALLLGCIFIFNEKFKTKSNFALAIVLFSLFLVIFRNIIENKLVSNEAHLFYYLPYFYGLLLPLGFYYSIVYLLNPDYQFKQKDYWFISSLGLVGGMDAIILFLYLFRFDVIRANPNILEWHGNYFINSVVIVYFVITLFLGWKKLNAYQKELLNNYSLIEGRDLQWFRNSLVITFVLVALFIAGEVSDFFYPSVGSLMFDLLCILCSGLVCWIAFKVITNQNYYLIPQFKVNYDSAISSKGLSEKTDEHYQNLLNLMQREKLFQNPELNMETLSQKMELSKGYVSKIINQNEGKNFYDFVNTYRVEEVKKNLNNPEFAHYSILGIGMAAGFKSKSTFNTVFKKITGVTPSVYKKRL